MFLIAAKLLWKSDREDLTVELTWDQVEKEGKGGSWGSSAKVKFPTAVVFACNIAISQNIRT